MKPGQRAWLFGILLAVLALPGGVFLYRHYLNPIARLAASIETGERYGALEARFARYALEHPDVVYTADVTAHHLHRRFTTASRQLFLYCKRWYGEIYLQVLFDTRGRVWEVVYLAE